MGRCGATGAERRNAIAETEGGPQKSSEWNIRRTSNRGNGNMRIETVLLTFGIASIVVGSAFIQQKPDDQRSLPLRLFQNAKEDDFTGSSACAECHATKYENFISSAHYAYMQVEGLPFNKKGCEGCHGPGKMHDPEKDTDVVIAFKKISAKEVSDATAQRSR